MAKTTPATAGGLERPPWLPWSALPFPTRYAR